LQWERIISCTCWNGRIVHLDASGNYLSEWGKKGSAPGEFRIAHGLTIDTRDRIYVADRGNDRVQIFSPDGKLLSVWSGFGNPFGLLIVGTELLVSAADAKAIFHVDVDGNITARWGGSSVLSRPHFMASNHKGELLVAEGNDAKSVQIFSRVEQKKD